MSQNLYPTLPQPAGRPLAPPPSTLDPRPSTLDPRPSTLDPRPSTLWPLLPALALLLTLLPGLPGRADELGDKGRAIFQKNRQAVVIVQMALKIKGSGPGAGEREARQEITGTVIDPSGLTVVSLSYTDPTTAYESMQTEGGSRPRFESELSDLKIVLEDGTEVPAEIVLRDRDLDLAFLRPKVKPASPMPAVDLSQSGKADLLEQVITITRLGNAAGRGHAASVERISGIVRRPRLFYVPDTTMTTTTTGTPAFTLEGKPLGIFLFRFAKGQASASASTLHGQGYASVILPAEDVLKAAKQAPAAATPPAEEKKDEKAK